MIIKKKLLIFLLTIFLLLPVYSTLADSSNLSNADAYKAIVKIITMGVDQNYNLSAVSNGSGVIISSDGLILTNYHFVTIKDHYDGSDKLAGFNICINQDMDQEPVCKYQAKLIAKDKDQDIALLQIVAIPGLSTMIDFPFLDLSTQDVNTNDELTALGFPNASGNAIKIAKGTVNGKYDKYNQSWIKTNAIMHLSSSGGIVINADGNVIGITREINLNDSSDEADISTDGDTITMTIKAKPYLSVVDINSLTSWINSNKNKTPRVNELSDKIVNFVKKRQEIKVSNQFINNKPSYSITKPNDWKFEHDNEYYLSIFKDGDNRGGKVDLEVYKYPFKIDSNIIPNFLDLFMINSGLFVTGSISKRSPAIINNNHGELVTISGLLNNINFYVFAKGQYVIRVEYEYGKDDKDKTIVDDIINSFTFTQDLPIDNPIYYYQNSEHHFTLNTSDNWVIKPQHSRSQPVEIHNTNETRAIVNIQVFEEDDDTKRLSDTEKLQEMKDDIASNGKFNAIFSIKTKITKSDINYKLNYKLNNIIRIEIVASRSDKIISRDLIYMIRKNSKLFLFKLETANMDIQDYNNIVAEFNSMLTGFSFDSQVQQHVNNKGEEKNKEEENKEEKNKKKEKQSIENKTTPRKFSKEMAQRLSGKILLQAENNGEAWYVEPSNLKRYYLKDGSTAYNALRKFGLGITNVDLAKIPIGIEDRAKGKDSDNDGLDDKTEEAISTNPNKADSDNDGYNDGDEIKNGYNPLGAGKINIDSGFASKQEGKILLQVQSRGEAWYIHNGKRYYMANGDFAYQIMRFLSLGITNTDLDKIETGDL